MGSGDALGAQVLVQTSYFEQNVRELLYIITYNTGLATSVKERKKTEERPGQSYQPPRESCRRISSIRLLNRDSIDPTLRHRPPNRPLPSLKPLALPRPLHNPPAPISPLSFRCRHRSPSLKRIRRPSDLPLSASTFVKPFEEVDEGVYERYYEEEFEAWVGEGTGEGCGGADGDARICGEEGDCEAGVREGGGGVVRTDGEDGGAYGAGEDVSVPAVDDLCSYAKKILNRPAATKMNTEGRYLLVGKLLEIFRTRAVVVRPLSKRRRQKALR